MATILMLLAVAGVSAYAGYRYGAGKLRQVCRERDNAWATLAAVGTPIPRSKREPRHNDGRSEVRRARWGTHQVWRR